MTACDSHLWYAGSASHEEVTGSNSTCKAHVNFCSPSVPAQRKLDDPVVLDLQSLSQAGRIRGGETQSSAHGELLCCCEQTDR